MDRLSKCSAMALERLAADVFTFVLNGIDPFAVQSVRVNIEWLDGSWNVPATI